jgi:hypothetical protein
MKHMDNRVKHLHFIAVNERNRFTIAQGDSARPCGRQCRSIAGVRA